MSNAIYPALPGLAWPVDLTPQFSTKVARSISLKEQRARYSAYPIYTLGLVYEFLRVDEFRQLLGFFNARAGSFDSFLFENVDDKSVTDQAFGVGNGTSTQFQLVRTFGAFTEPVCNLNGAPVIKIDGVTKVLGTHYTLSATGLVSFVTAPAAGVVLTWTGGYYWRVRFKDDTSKYGKFSSGLWDNKRVELIGATGNKV